MDYKYTGNYHEIKTEEWLIEEEGIKLNFSECKAAELIVEFSNYELPGWIIVGDIEVLADAVSHTKKGAIGKVVRSSLTHCLIVDGENPLAEQIDLGPFSAITDEQRTSFDEVLDEYDSKMICNGPVKSNFLDDTKWKLFLVSNKEVYIIAKNALVIANGSDKEVFVKYSDDKNNAHVFVDKGSVNVHANNCDIVVDKHDQSVVINGKDIKEIVNNVLSDVKNAFSFSF